MLQLIKFVVPIFAINVDETINFYCKLGFEIVSKDLLLRDKIIYLNIYQDTDEININEKKNKFVNLLFSIQVNNTEELKQELIDSGITITEIYDTPIGEYVYIRDPNGFRICLYELYR